MNFRSKALSGLAWQIAHENIGIYALAYHAPADKGGYEKRTERMEGWNECAIAHSKMAMAVQTWMRALPAEQKTIVEDMLLQGTLELRVSDETVSMAVDCSDLFFWGCSDAEDIELSELGELERAIKDAAEAGSESGGGLLWVARKREMRPQGAYYAHVAPGLAKLFDTCGEYRKSEIGNPVGSSFDEGEAYREKRS